jgi:hypothetical protein
LEQLPELAEDPELLIELDTLSQVAVMGAKRRLLEHGAQGGTFAEWLNDMEAPFSPSA